MLDLLVATKLDSDDGQEGFRINGDLAGSGTDKPSKPNRADKPRRKVRSAVWVKQP